MWAGGQGAFVPASFVVEGPTLVRPIVWRHKLAHYMESSIDITASSGTHEAAIEGERRPEGPARVAQGTSENSSAIDRGAAPQSKSNEFSEVPLLVYALERCEDTDRSQK